MNKVVSFEDKNIKFILLDKGDYLVDGEVISVDTYNKSRVKVINENDVRIIRKNIITEHYVNTDTAEIISEIEYRERLKELLSNKTYKNEYDEDGTWNTLDDEFNYRKFKLEWKEIKKTVQSISDPILVEKVRATYDTGNKFIVNAYLNGDKEHDMYIYDREKAYKSIVEECFNELKMSFDGNCGCDKTKNKKIWGNSSHSCIRYVVAFGTYIFDDRFKNTTPSKGTLEDMKDAYEKSRNSIRKIIKTGYNTAFGNIDEDKIDFKLMLKDLYSLRGNINSIDSKKSTWSNQNQANRKINEIINYIEDKFE